MSSSAFKGADVSDRLDRAIDNALADNRLVGTVVIVARGGKIAYRRAAGFADRESQKPMQTDSIFRFASVTKPFVTAAVMRLIEDGVVRLDDPVTRFLPDFQPRLSDGSVPVISIRHLLTHTSGLGYPFQEGAMAIIVASTSPTGWINRDCRYPRIFGAWLPPRLPPHRGRVFAIPLAWM